ncbi:T9SS type A sorting domain-containing protein [Crocinitomix catalasitica]|uniref:T9SS type A sorting domain-containing protein n=1 Tax=Crocinitomix catalasitica TaxID=184607 RepID=UPI0009FFAD86|nr:T9SS type A sorting domain-containing protein [Crocinitomix catalasitica]
MFKLFFLLITICIGSVLYSQKFEWIKDTYPGVSKMGLSPKGNLFYYGPYDTTSNHTVNGVTLAPLEFNNQQLFLAKHDNYGKIKWVFNSKNTELSRELTLVNITFDENENIYATGYFSGSHQFGENRLTASPIDSLTNFIFKLNTNGEVLWAKKISSELEAARISSIQTDGDGNSIISFFNVKNIQYDGQTIIETSKNSNIILRINSAGKYIWHEVTESNLDIKAVSLPKNEFILARNFRHQFIWPNKDTIINTNQLQNGIIQLYSTNGILKKTCILKKENDGFARIISIASDDAGDLYVLLSTDTSALLIYDKSFKIKRELVLLKLNAQLNAIWCMDLPPEYRTESNRTTNHIFIDPQRNPVIVAQLIAYEFFFETSEIIGLLSTTIDSENGRLLKNKYIDKLGVKSIGGLDEYNNLYVAGIIDVSAPVMGTQLAQNNEVTKITKISQVVFDDFPSDEFIAFPNPFIDEFTLIRDHEGKGQFEVNIYSIDGKLILNEKITSEGMLQYYINTTNWLQGIYLVEMIYNDASTAIKMIKAG